MEYGFLQKVTLVGTNNHPHEEGRERDMNATTWLWVTAVLAPIPHAIALFRARFAPCMSGSLSGAYTHGLLLQACLLALQA